MRISLSVMSIAVTISVCNILGLAINNSNLIASERGSGRIQSEQIDRGSGRITTKLIDRGSGRITIEQAYRGSGRITPENAYRGSGRLTA
ncbi:MAG: hypothetical protein KTR27_12000 [Leptolyngbyaceae cyanobacterium MAG.088]|nr:hypothetical protein [Leptolyngbyaceae cyanobacterium MAG.088]